jgi:hypothetical protein
LAQVGERFLKMGLRVLQSSGAFEVVDDTQPAVVWVWVSERWVPISRSLRNHTRWQGLVVRVIQRGEMWRRVGIRIVQAQILREVATDAHNMVRRI